TTWHIFAAPKGTPAQIVATLNDKVRTALKTLDAVKRWQDRGLDVIASTPDEMTAHLNREIRKWRVVFKEQAIKAE
ncbi:MAG: tripartite tricarboxylate transporter substrate binding protein, partial [Burkholderiales bacterium]